MKLFLKIFLYSLALSLLPLLIVAVLSKWQIGVEVERRTVHALEENVTLLVPIAREAFSDPGALQRGLRKLDPRTRFTVIRLDGHVLADSWKDPSVMENHASRPEFVMARTQRFGHSSRYSKTIGTDMLYVATRLEVEGAVRGLVRAARARADVATWTSAMQSWLYMAFLTSLGCGALLAYVIARRRSGTLKRMSSAAQAIASGDYELRVSGLPSDELGDLGRTFNTMAEQLSSRLDAITRERRRLTTVLAGMVEGVIAVDADERVVHCNDAARRILELPDESPIGRPVWEVVRLAQVPDTFRRVAQTGAPVITEAVVAREGWVGTLKLHASPLRAEGAREPSELAGAVLVVHDITEVHRLEKVRRDFVANASHELKTPVASIRGMVETILDDEEMSEGDRNRFLNRVLTQSARLQQLVEEMLALSRLEAADEGLAEEEIDVREPVNEACEAVAPLAREKQITFTRRLPDEHIPARARREAVRRIAANLLDNAVKYTPPEGRVDLDLSTENGWVVLSVADTGLGIPSDKEHRVFERFYRIDEGRDRAVGGSGLGLAIVKHLAMALGGDVSLKTREGRGSRFVVRVPRAEPGP